MEDISLSHLIVIPKMETLHSTTIGAYIGPFLREVRISILIQGVPGWEHGVLLNPKKP